MACLNINQINVDNILYQTRLVTDSGINAPIRYVNKNNRQQLIRFKTPVVQSRFGIDSGGSITRDKYYIQLELSGYNKNKDNKEHPITQLHDLIVRMEDACIETADRQGWFTKENIGLGTTMNPCTGEFLSCIRYTEGHDPLFKVKVPFKYDKFYFKIKGKYMSTSDDIVPGTNLKATVELHNYWIVRDSKKANHLKIGPLWELKEVEIVD